MSSNEHPNATLGDFSIDSAMTQTQLHINPVHHQPLFPYDHAFPSMSSYPFSPHQATPGVDPYRNSPARPHTAAPAVNLPPIRSIESHPHQPPQPSPSPSSAVSNPYVTPLQGQNAIPPYAPQMGHMPPYYPSPMAGPYGQPMVGGQINMNMATTPPGLRYPIPPGDLNKTLSGGRHKKEVKRRTKTGCLTCRRRRIKCDEAQPTCRNCQKSKRDCLGYDPIFKPQPGTSSVQPALKLAQPESPASTQSYAASSLIQAQSHSQSQSTATDSPRSSLSQPDVVPPQNPDTLSHATPSSYGMLPEAGAPSSTVTSFPSGAHTPLTSKIPNPKPFLIPFSKRLRLDEMYNIDGLPPQSDYESTVSDEDSDRIQNHYLQHYAPHLDRFFEARFWQSDILRQTNGNGHIMRQYKNFLNRQADRGQSKPLATLSEEVKLIWALFDLSSNSANSMNGAPWIPSPEEVQRRNVLAHRLRVLEALLSGEYLNANPLSPPDQAVSNPGITNQLKQREMEFWFCIGRIVSTQDTDASSAKQLDDALDRCRAVLNKFEQRDVIYSIAVVRHVCRRWGGEMKLRPGVAEAKKAYDIATDFLQKETMQGTNPVIQRICSMATKIWK